MAEVSTAEGDAGSRAESSRVREMEEAVILFSKEQGCPFGGGSGSRSGKSAKRFLRSITGG